MAAFQKLRYPRPVILALGVFSSGEVSLLS
jgi:hypothetical protein